MRQLLKSRHESPPACSGGGAAGGALCRQHRAGPSRRAPLTSHTTRRAAIRVGLGRRGATQYEVLAVARTSELMSRW